MSNRILIGKGIHQSKSNNHLIISLVSDAKIGHTVNDEDEKIIGKIFDIFGPVDAPYAAIKLNEDEKLGKVDGKPVYTRKVFKKNKKRRNSR